MDAANAVQDKQGRILSKSQALAKQKLPNFDNHNTWVDVNLGQSPTQQQAFLEAAAAQAVEAVMYNFNEDRSINPVAQHRDGDMAFTAAQGLSLGPTAYEVVGDTESIASKDDRAFFTSALDEADNTEARGDNLWLQMDVVHQDGAKAAGIATESIMPADSSSSSSSKYSQPPTWVPKWAVGPDPCKEGSKQGSGAQPRKGICRTTHRKNSVLKKVLQALHTGARSTPQAMSAAVEDNAQDTNEVLPDKPGTSANRGGSGNY